MSAYWFWLDLEMTGLDPQTDRILEAAAIVTRVQPVRGEAGQSELAVSVSASTSANPATCGNPAVSVSPMPQFDPVAQFESAVFQPQEVLGRMDEWNRKTHGDSGLIARVPQGITEAALDTALCELADRYWATAADATQGEHGSMAVDAFQTESGAKASGVILCGNSIGQDRKFVDRYLPQFASRLHYRMLDVSSFKIVYQQLYGRSFKKQNTHRALDDIRESIAELQFYLAG